MLDNSGNSLKIALPCISLKNTKSEIQQVVWELVALPQKCDRQASDQVPKIAKASRGIEANQPTHLRGRSPQALASCSFQRLGAGGGGAE